MRRQRSRVLRLGGYRLGIEIDHLPAVGVGLVGDRRDVGRCEVAGDGQVFEIVEKDDHPRLAVDAGIGLRPQDRGELRVHPRVELASQPLDGEGGHHLAVLHVDDAVLAHVDHGGADLTVAARVPGDGPEGVGLADHGFGHQRPVGRRRPQRPWRQRAAAAAAASGRKDRRQAAEGENERQRGDDYDGGRSDAEGAGWSGSKHNSHYSYYCSGQASSRRTPRRFTRPLIPWRV